MGNKTYVKLALSNTHSISISSPINPTHKGLGEINWGVPCGTNLGINGLVSADRNNKATLPLTTPRCTIKSSAKDLSLRIVKLQYTSKDHELFRPQPRR